MPTREASILLRANRLITTSLQEELRQQGHSLTGALENSITGVVKENGSDVNLEGTILLYGLYVNFGVTARRVPFNLGSGAKHSEYIDNLVRFFKLRGLDDKNARSAAFATAIKQKKEGMPTAGSYQYTKNRMRKSFIDRVADRIDKKLDSTIINGFEDLIEQTFQSTKSEII